jgi:hypothetical protein
VISWVVIFSLILQRDEEWSELIEAVPDIEQSTIVTLGLYTVFAWMPVCTRINKVGKVLGLLVVTVGQFVFAIEMLRVIYFDNG